MNIYGIKRVDLENYFLSNGEKKFKALQIYEWLYDKRVKSFYDMTNIKKEWQEKLSNDFSNDYIKIVKKQEDNLTRKYLFQLVDDNYIEAVLMEHDDNKPSGVVLEVLQKGYMYKDKCIRPAMVKVNE